MTVDVLLPFRDASEWIEDAVRSLLAQTHRDFRALLLDDGSDDDGAERVTRAVAADPRFLVRRREPRGLVASLNELVAWSNAPLLARLDADDIAAPERLERQVARFAAASPPDVVSCRVSFRGTISPRLRRYETWLNSLVTHEEIEADLWVESPIPHPTAMIRRDALLALGGYRDFDGPEDYDLWLRGWRAGWRFEKVPEVLMELRDHEARLTKTDSRYLSRAFLDLKATHLVEARELVGRDVVVWGAGRDGVRTAKALRDRGANLVAFVDVAPTKIGRQRRGVPTEPIEFLRLEHGRRPYVVAAVGVRGARALIRERLREYGYSEGAEFACFG
ncbi:MAG: glycosyltransferase [bacterium]